MSTPPPVTPPTPQPPPTYSQYPPPSGYPPPYAPQQPYYASPAPPPKDTHLALIIVVVVIVVVVVLALVLWWAVTALMAPVTSSQITVTGVSFSVAYPGSFQYFGGPTVTTCNQCPIHTSLIVQFTFTLSLHNIDTVDHNVTDVTITGTSFSLVSASPSPSAGSPVVVNAGATRNIILTIQPTTLAGTYTLTGTIATD